MGFREFIEEDLSESAQMKLELINKIGMLMGNADLTDLKRILKILEKAAE